MGEDSIPEFWKCFADNQRALVRPVDPNALNDVLRALRQVDRRFYYHVGERDERTDLILSAEGHCDALPLLRQVRDGAPTVPGWRVLAFFDGDLAIGRRNTAIFPEDENGDVLYRMARSGDELCIARAINFSVVFPDASAQRMFLLRLEEEGLTGRPEDGGHEPWDVTVTEAMLPTHANITALEC